jgi:hypothetical protein
MDEHTNLRRGHGTGEGGRDSGVAFEKKSGEIRPRARGEVGDPGGVDHRIDSLEHGGSDAGEIDDESTRSLPTHP